MESLHLNSVIENGKYKDKTVSSLVKNKRAMFNLIKEGYQFDDEVLKEAKIKKITHAPTFSNNVGEHKMDKKKYNKDKESVSSVLKKMNNTDEETIKEATINIDELGDIIDYGEYSN